MRRKVIVGLVLMVLAAGILLAGRYWGRFGPPQLRYPACWAIGLYKGASPFDLKQPADVQNPIIQAKDVTDLDCRFVADPFLVREGAMWYIFFEALDSKANKGVLAFASSPDGDHWKYGGVIINEPFHMSFPYVFKVGEQYYMVPESAMGYGVRLYRAVKFPDQWTFDSVLINRQLADPATFQYEGKWYMFASPYSMAGREPGAKKNDTLVLYVADDLRGPWAPHPKSPILRRDAHLTRPAGRVLSVDGKLYRFPQDDDPDYGIQVWAFEITKLTPTEYEEKMVGTGPVLAPGAAKWCLEGMHTLNAVQVGPQEWWASVDGRHTEWNRF